MTLSQGKTENSVEAQVLSDVFVGLALLPHRLSLSPHRWRRRRKRYEVR